MSLSDRSLRLRKFDAFVVCVGLGLLGCEGAAGRATVSARFERAECKRGVERPLENYSFDADYLATERFVGILHVIIQKHRVDVEETDGLVIRFSIQKMLESGVLIFDRGQIVRADPSSPIIVQTSTAPSAANVSLSLFQTCPEFPTHYARGGVLTFDKLTLAGDPEDTGTGEVIAGTLTATLSRASETEPVGTLDAVFDFEPPRRPLTDFK
jgi:hypothetical protein